MLHCQAMSRHALAVVVFVGAVGLAGCATEAAFARASNEFGCPRERIFMIDRQDIAAGLYDVDACGARARYMCLSTEEMDPAGSCVREPDPPQWSPDPALLASRRDAPRVAQICPRTGEPNDCLVFKDGTWTWYHHEVPGPMGQRPFAPD